MKNEVIALVVSYNGGEDLVNTVTALAPQVKKVLILDNGSNALNQEIISMLAVKSPASIVRLNSNKGIGFALNRGVEIARAEGFDWVLTMDQDSIASPKMIAEMLASAARISGINVICPSLVRAGVNEFQADDQFVEYSITSGNLIPVEVFAVVGGFNEDYFIDSVDFEFSLRVKNSGLRMIQSGCAKLKHKLGENIVIKMAAIEYRYISHSPLRRYYIFRNHMRLISDFWAKNPIFLIKKSIALTYLFFEILLLDPQRKENLKMIFTGLCDFFRGKSGRFDG